MTFYEGEKGKKVAFNSSSCLVRTMPQFEFPHQRHSFQPHFHFYWFGQSLRLTLVLVRPIWFFSLNFGHFRTFFTLPLFIVLFRVFCCHSTRCLSPLTKVAAMAASGWLQQQSSLSYVWWWRWRRRRWCRLWLSDNDDITDADDDGKLWTFSINPIAFWPLADEPEQCCLLCVVVSNAAKSFAGIQSK